MEGLHSLKDSLHGWEGWTGHCWIILLYLLFLSLPLQYWCLVTSTAAGNDHSTSTISTSKSSVNYYYAFACVHQFFPPYERQQCYCFTFLKDFAWSSYAAKYDDMIWYWISFLTDTDKVILLMTYICVGMTMDGFKPHAALDKRKLIIPDCTDCCWISALAISHGDKRVPFFSKLSPLFLQLPSHTHLLSCPCTGVRLLNKSSHNLIRHDG